MKNLLSTLLLAGALIAASRQSEAAVLYGPVTNAINGHLYYLLSPQNWLAAQSESQTLGGNLATINDEDEENWIYSTFASYQSIPRPLWIGLNDGATQGQFVWVNGEPVTYTNWGAGEPNDTIGFENFVGIWASNGTQPGKWNDLPGTEQYYGVVEVVPPFKAAIRVSEVTLSWPSVVGKSYQVQFKDSASDPTWEALGPVRAGTGGALEYADEVINPGRIYQISELP